MASAVSLTEEAPQADLETRAAKLPAPCFQTKSASLRRSRTPGLQKGSMPTPRQHAHANTKTSEPRERPRTWGPGRYGRALKAWSSPWFSRGLTSVSPQSTHNPVVRASPDPGSIPQPPRKGVVESDGSGRGGAPSAGLAARVRGALNRAAEAWTGFLHPSL